MMLGLGRYGKTEDKLFLKVLLCSKRHVIISVTIIMKGTPRVSLENVRSGTVSLKLAVGTRILFGSHMSFFFTLCKWPFGYNRHMGYLFLSLQSNQVYKDLNSVQGSKE